MELNCLIGLFHLRSWGGGMEKFTDLSPHLTGFTLNQTWVRSILRQSFGFMVSKTQLLILPKLRLGNFGLRTHVCIKPRLNLFHLSGLVKTLTWAIKICKKGTMFSYESFSKWDGGKNSILIYYAHLIIKIKGVSPLKPMGTNLSSICYKNTLDQIILPWENLIISVGQSVVPWPIENNWAIWY